MSPVRYFRATVRAIVLIGAAPAPALRCREELLAHDLAVTRLVDEQHVHRHAMPRARPDMRHSALA
jgi:hypothetical protein